MQDLFIPLLLGSGREGRFSEAAAKYVFGRLQKAGVRTQFVDVRDITNPTTHGPKQPSDRTAPWRELMAQADGLFVVTPEYNRGYPGELKIAIDSLDKEYKRKAVAIAGVSSGVFGGTRVILALRQVFTYLGMVPTSLELNFGNCQTLFTADGSVTDPAFDGRTDKVIAEVILLAKAMRVARELEN